MSKRLIILTEAGHDKGFGHFTRMKGLLERLDRVQNEKLLFLDADEEARALLCRENVMAAAWIDPVWIDKHITDSDVVLVDSYYVDLNLIKQIGQQCRKLFIIDDNQRLPYEGMSVINPNYFGTSLNYPREKSNRYYVGKDYTLTRQEFLPRGKRIVRKNVSKILVSFGGTDPRNMTLRVLERLQHAYADCSLDIVVTHAFRDLEKIKPCIRSVDRLHIDASAQTMSDLMWNVDFAVTSGGGTSNELIKMQCPAILFEVADNQRINIQYLRKNHLALVATQRTFLQVLPHMMAESMRRQLVLQLEQLASNHCAADEIQKALD